MTGRSVVLALALGLVSAEARAVVGGQEDKGPLARATVMVLSSNGGMCSAVVVARDAVLTAAHCARGAAEHRVHFRDKAGAPVLIIPAAKAVHPAYDAKAIEARRRSVDLALVRLPQALPARFETVALTAAAPAAGAALVLGGYGVLREGDERSTGTFRSAALTVVEPYGPSRLLVWLKDAGGAGACLGDSGGPIAGGGPIASGDPIAGGGPAPAGERVVAITAWAKGSPAKAGAKGRACGEVSQGVLVGPQKEWIDRTLAGWGRSAAWD